MFWYPVKLHLQKATLSAETASATACFVGLAVFSMVSSSAVNPKPYTAENNIKRKLYLFLHRIAKKIILKKKRKLEN